MRLSVSAVTLGMLLCAGPSSAWQRHLGDQSSRADDLDVDSAGDLVVAGDAPTFSIFKLDASKGTELWHYSLPAGIYDSSGARAVTIDPQGFIVATGTQSQSAPLNVDIAVVKLDPIVGLEQWRRTIHEGQVDIPFAVATDGSSDVFVAGVAAPSLFVIKMSGVDGQEIWRHEVQGTAASAQAFALAVDASGNPVVAGETSNTGSGRDLAVLKLDGSDGSEIWRREIDGGGATDAGSDVAVDAAGDVIVCGDLGTDFAVLKLAGASGATLWSYSVVGDSNFDACRGIAVTATGDVVAGGSALLVPDDTTSFMVKLAGGSGGEMWRSTRAEAGISDVALDAAGNVLTAGGAEENGQGMLSRSFAVMKHDGITGLESWHFAIGGPSGGAAAIGVSPNGTVFAAGTLDRPSGGNFGAVALGQKIGGRKLTVRSRNVSQPAIRLAVKSNDDGIFAPARGSAADPKINGASLELRNPVSGEVEIINLSDDDKWTVSGAEGGPRGYQYRDGSLQPGTCRKVRVSPQGRIDIACRPASFTLDEATQGSLAVKLTLGAGLQYCMVFGSGVLADAPGRFIAKDVIAPAVCP